MLLCRPEREAAYAGPAKAPVRDCGNIGIMETGMTGIGEREDYGDE